MERLSKDTLDCLEWIEACIHAVLKPKADKVRKMYTEEDSRLLFQVP
jgi:hypothetical protein